MSAQASRLDFASQTVCAPLALLLDQNAPPPRALERLENRRPMDRDDELLELIALGDQGAFRQLVERHVDRAYALAFRILRNGADAEDVVQDTLLKIWSQRGTWQSGRARFSTWLYRVVTNRCLDMRRRPKTEDMDNAPETVDAQPDALATMQRHEASDLLAREMERLPDQQRVALILSYYDDLSNAQIAEVMDTSVQAVESLLKRGRQHLRKQLHGTGRDICRSFTGD